MAGKVFCIIVTYNGMPWIDNCLQSLRRTDYPVDAIVVDNASTDMTVEHVRRNYPEVILIASKENLGFGKGNTVGVDKAIELKGEFVFLLNQDAYWFGGSFAGLLKSFELDPMIGIISPVHLAPDGRNLDFGFLRCMDPARTPYLLGDSVVSRKSQLYDSAFVNAAAWIIRVDMIKHIGFFHPAFYHYGEDMEYTRRMGKFSYRLCVWPESTIVHDRQQHRAGNKFYEYGDKIQRRSLLDLVEGRVTFKRVSIRFFRLVLINLFTLRFRNVQSLIANWIFLNSRRKYL